MYLQENSFKTSAYNISELKLWIDCTAYIKQYKYDICDKSICDKMAKVAVQKRQTKE